MRIDRVFTRDDDAYASINWVRTDSEIRNPDGSTVFSMKGIEVPGEWSKVAVDVLAQKYFRKAGVPSVTKLVDEPEVPRWLQRRVPAEGATFGAETSAQQVFDRLAGAWTYWGWKMGMFDPTADQLDGTVASVLAEENAAAFYDEMRFMLAKQIAAPNSPQWFNTGLYWAYGIDGPSQGHYYYDKFEDRVVESKSSYERPQPHACFIQSVGDDLVNEGGIMDLWTREARLFKYGSGTGSNFSAIRGESEKLSGGGKSSGLMSFLKIGDASAGAIKSGGTTRRAAKMVVLDIDHPDVQDFIEWKSREEDKVAALVAGSKVVKKHVNAVMRACVNCVAEGDACFDPKKNPALHREIRLARRASVPDSYIQRTVQMARQGLKEVDFDEFNLDWGSEAYATVSGQNSNNSIRVSDEFMHAVDKGADWNLISRLDKRVMKTVQARDLWNSVGHAAWASADPGVQFDTTINDWHTCSVDGRINASNPCSEYVFLDDTACFTGDTKVWTMDGPVRFDELAKSNKPVPVLTELDDGSLAYRDMVLPRKTKRDAELVEVTLRRRGARGRPSNDTVVCVTPDHEFFLRDGTRKQAGDLSSDDRIKSVYRYDSDRYVWLNSTSEGMVREHVVATEYGHGRRPGTGEHAHHRDENPRNNNYRNMAIVDGAEHIGRHVREWFEQADEKTAIRRGRRISITKRGVKPTPEALAALRSAAKRRRGVKQDPETVSRRSASNTGKKRSTATLRKMRHAWDKRRAEGRMGETAGTIWVTNDSENMRISSTQRIPRGWRKGRASWKKKATDNHSVVSVRRIRRREDVYCGTVPTTGRFFISLGDNHEEGILVKNCNLASINLLKFGLVRDFDTRTFTHVARLWTIALEISVEMAQFPSKEIALRSYLYRTLGLGYANVGGLLMSSGMGYDSEEGRAAVGGITAIMTATAYATSAQMAEQLGPFVRYGVNKPFMEKVIINHRAAAVDGKFEGLSINPPMLGPDCPAHLRSCAIAAWSHAYDLGQQHGYRNAQVTCIAPTGCTLSTTRIQTEAGVKSYRDIMDENGIDWKSIETTHTPRWISLKPFWLPSQDGHRDFADKIWYNGVQETYVVSFEDGTEFECTGNHKLLVRLGNGETAWIEAQYLKGDEEVVSS